MKVRVAGLSPRQRKNVFPSGWGEDAVTRKLIHSGIECDLSIRQSPGKKLDVLESPGNRLTRVSNKKVLEVNLSQLRKN